MVQEHIEHMVHKIRASAYSCTSRVHLWTATIVTVELRRYYRKGVAFQCGLVLPAYNTSVVYIVHYVEQLYNKYSCTAERTALS